MAEEEEGERPGEGWGDHGDAGRVMEVRRKSGPRFPRLEAAIACPAKLRGQAFGLDGFRVGQRRR